MNGWPQSGGWHEGGLPTRRPAIAADTAPDGRACGLVASGGSVRDAAELIGIRPSTAKRHLADMRARSGLSTEQLIYAGRAAGWLVVSGLEPS